MTPPELSETLSQADGFDHAAAMERKNGNTLFAKQLQDHAEYLRLVAERIEKSLKEAV